MPSILAPWGCSRLKNSGEIRYNETMRCFPLTPGLLLWILVTGAMHPFRTVAQEIRFARDILPILSDRCFACHGPDAQAREADLRLDLRQGLFRRDGDTVIVKPGSAEESELMRRILSDDPDERMPPEATKKPLTSEQVARLRQWIEQGAPWEGHWAFEPVRRPRVPHVRGGDRARNPIDLFVLAELEQLSAKSPPSLAPEASAERLMRRVTFDLTGLPPTWKQLESVQAVASAADNSGPRTLRPQVALPTEESPARSAAEEPTWSADGYEQYVAQLLASPRYGERMAWDWLEAARYADSNGFQGDRERTMWPWRDWVIRAFNQNLPFDQFTVWQLAGDKLPGHSAEQQLATGFCRNHMINGEGGRIPEENRVEYVFDQMETVGTVWMGLTVQCCRCHDHKFDPLTQREYYQLFAIFNQTPVNGGGGDPQTPPVLECPTAGQQAELAEVASQRNSSQARLQAWEQDNLARLDRGGTENDAPPPPNANSATSLPPAIRELLQKPLPDRTDSQWRDLEKHFAESATEYAEFIRQHLQLLERQANLQRRVPHVMVMQDLPPEKQRPTYILDKGLYNQPRDSVDADGPSLLPALADERPRDRLALAQVLVDPANPLTARVTVNRLWQMFFGTGLVKTAEDFGVQGEKPSHPELLDWLAAEFVDSGWDVKHLVRLIVTSGTYRQSARATDQQWQLDPENRSLARGPRRRLTSWMMRDQALAASGLLAESMFGDPVNSYQPAGVWEEATFGNKKYERDRGEKLYRRSLYIFWRRIVGPTMFFDVSKRQTCSVKTPLTNTPLHALIALNDEAYVEAARQLASRVWRQVAQQPDLSSPAPAAPPAGGETSSSGAASFAEEDARRRAVALAFRLVTSRRPKADEVAVLSQRWQTWQEHYQQHPEAASELLAVGESPADTTIPPHELAALTAVCQLILNLDEALTK